MIDTFSLKGMGTGIKNGILKEGTVKVGFDRGMLVS